MIRAIGLEWGYTDPWEVTSRPMTRIEYHRWFHPGQACVMLAFKLDNSIARLENVTSYLEPKAAKEASSWLIQ